MQEKNRKKLLKKVETEEELLCIAKMEEEIFGKEAWSLKQIKEEFKNSFSEIFVFENGKKLGYVIYRKLLDEGEILRIGIKKEYQGRGFGKKLLKELLEILKEKGIKAVFLEVRENNAPAIRLYEKNGFRVLGKRKGYYSGEDALIMEKILK
jgi:ribosomal-protein-alanine N-acetyltransferase